MSGIDRLLEIMERLRDPESGCPWDRQQDFASIAPYTVEEAYEVDDAIRQGDMDALREELGDLLLQVVYHAQMAREAGHFDFDEIARGIGAKLIRRHPHVFAGAPAGSDADRRRVWEEEKERERAEKAEASGAKSADGAAADDPFAGVPLALPALARAAKLQKRAARLVTGPAAVPDPEVAHARALSALERLHPGQPGEAASAPGGPSRGDLGRLLFATVELARGLELDAEQALRETAAAFEAETRASSNRRQARRRPSR